MTEYHQSMSIITNIKNICLFLLVYTTCMKHCLVSKGGHNFSNNSTSVRLPLDSSPYWPTKQSIEVHVYNNVNKLFWPRIHTNMNTPLPPPKKRCQLVQVFTFIKIIVTSSFYFALEMTSRIYIPNFMQLPGGVLNTTCSKLTCIGKFIPEVSKIIHELSMFSEQQAKLWILFIQNLMFYCSLEYI